MKTIWRPYLLGYVVPFIILSKAFAIAPTNMHCPLTPENPSAVANKAPAGGDSTLQYLRLQLAKDSVNTDEIIIEFNSTASPKYNANEDAEYLEGFGQVHLFSYSADSIPLAINALPFPKLKADIIRLNVSAKASGTLQLNMKQMVNIPKQYDIWLIDKYKNDSLDMRENNIYSFNLYNTDTASYGPNRFALVIRQDPAYAYKLLSFTANKVPDVAQVQLAWTTANEDNYTRFTLERSKNNGTSYDTLCVMQSSGQGKYSITDKNPATQNLYRLKQEDVSGNITFTDPVPVSFQDQNITANVLSIYPNPVNDMINLSVSSPGAGDATYKIKLMDSSGLTIREATSSKPAWQGDISGVRPGVYFAQVLDNKTNTLIGRKKFVKY